MVLSFSAPCGVLAPVLAGRAAGAQRLAMEKTPESAGRYAGQVAEFEAAAGQKSRFAKQLRLPQSAF
jgi:hypothetical protein